MSFRVRSLAFAAFAILLTLVVAPSHAWAQTPGPFTREVTTAPAVNLLSGVSFLPATAADDVTAPADTTAAPAPALPRQGGGHGGFGIGVKGGYLLSSFTTTSSISYNNKSGFIGGLWFGGNRGGVVGVMGELLYAKRTDSTAAGDTDLHYLEIPILLRINIGQEGANGARFYILAGPVADILLKASGLNVKDNYQSVDAGVKLGAGFEIFRVLIEGQYNIGLRNVLNPDNLGAATEIKSRTLEIMFGVRFN